MGNPYAMQDRLQAEREDAADAFTAWAEREGIEDPTDADYARYEQECEDAAQDAAEARAEAMSEDRDCEPDYF